MRAVSHSRGTGFSLWSLLQLVNLACFTDPLGSGWPNTSDSKSHTAEWDLLHPVLSQPLPRLQLGKQLVDLVFLFQSRQSLVHRVGNQLGVGMAHRFGMRDFAPGAVKRDPRAVAGRAARFRSACQG